MKNKVFIATSLDGYIADKNGGINWLNTIPNPDNIDMGYVEFISSIDAIIMGRRTFETVCSFDMDWPYQKPVFVLSSSLSYIPPKFSDYVTLVKGNLSEILKTLEEKGYSNLYIDGGKTVNSFLELDLIDEITITTIPIILGGGIPLFSEISETLNFKCTDTKIYLEGIVQNKFIRDR